MCNKPLQKLHGTNPVIGISSDLFSVKLQPTEKLKSILYPARFAITEIDFVPGLFRCWIELGHIDFAVVAADLALLYALLFSRDV